MLICFECTKLSCATEISDSMEYSERPFKIFVDLGNYKFQIHSLSDGFAQVAVCTPRGIGNFICGKK
jgi:hypothetical protein